TVRMPDGTTLTKSDAGGYAGMSDSGDDEKSGYSDGFKRAAVKFGVARYLYRDGTPTFVQERMPAESDHRGTAGTEGRQSRTSEPGQAAARSEGPGGPPRTGKALFAWTKEQEQRHAVGLLKYLNGWAKLQEFPARMVDWDTDQVSLAYTEACRKLQVTPSSRSEAYEEALAN